MQDDAHARIPQPLLDALGAVYDCGGMTTAGRVALLTGCDTDTAAQSLEVLVISGFVQPLEGGRYEIVSSQEDAIFTLLSGLPAHPEPKPAATAPPTRAPARPAADGKEDERPPLEPVTSCAWPRRRARARKRHAAMAFSETAAMFNGTRCG